MHIGCCSVLRAAGAGGGAAVFISAGLNDTDNVESRRVQPPIMQLQCSSAPPHHRIHRLEAGQDTSKTPQEGVSGVGPCKIAVQ